MKLKYLIIPVIALAIASCDKSQLDPLPQTNLIDTAAFSTASRVQQEVNGMYAALKAGNFMAGRYVVYQEIRGEDFSNRTSNGVTGFQTWGFAILPSTNEVQNLWNAIYQTVNRTNVVLAGLDIAQGKNVVTQEKANNFRGEARFIRGFCYYALMTLYARPYWDGAGAKPGVPLRLKAETLIDPASNQIPRAKASEVYAQIIQDLDFAEANLPATGTITHAHVNAAIALKTRVYLTQGDYPKVITEANKIVNNAPPFAAATGIKHQLMPNIATVFAPPYTSLENIFSMPFTSLDLAGTQNSLGSYYNPSSLGGGADYSLNTTGIIANAGWKASDARRSFINASNFLIKFPNNPGGSNPDWLPVIRYAEVLLSLSEAITRNSNSVDQRAVDLLNAVRTRSDATTSWTTGSFANAQALLDQIAIERRIELVGEGLRSIDITRKNESFPSKPHASGGTAGPAVAPTDIQYIWPIPLSEKLVNTGIEQNPGY